MALPRTVRITFSSVPLCNSPTFPSKVQRLMRWWGIISSADFITGYVQYADVWLALAASVTIHHLMLFEFGSLILVAILWGGTNPLIKHGSRDIVKVRAESCIGQFILELKYLFTNLKYILPMIFNQLGSIIYFYTLQGVDISLAVPVANSLTFVFTAISSWILKEKQPGLRTHLGSLLILLGTSLCYFDKYIQNKMLPSST